MEVRWVFMLKFHMLYEILIYNFSYFWLVKFKSILALKWLLMYMLYSPLTVLTVCFSLVFFLAKREKLFEKRKKAFGFSEENKKDIESLG